MKQQRREPHTGMPYQIRVIVYTRSAKAVAEILRHKAEFTSILTLRRVRTMNSRMKSSAARHKQLIDD